MVFTQLLTMHFKVGVMFVQRQVSYSCGLYYKSFTIVIYNRNDSTIVIYDCSDSGKYYKTMILAILALSRSVNYDRKIMLQIGAYLLRL
jgi:hypothetical protein